MSGESVGLLEPGRQIALNEIKSGNKNLWVIGYKISSTANKDKKSKSRGVELNPATDSDASLLLGQRNKRIKLENYGVSGWGKNYRWI